MLHAAVTALKHVVPRPLHPRLGIHEPQYPPRPLRVPARYHAQEPPTPTPSISIVTPSLNQGCYIGSTVESLLGQRYPRLEHVVVDGGSHDDTAEVLARYLHRIDRLESSPGRTQVDAINRGLDDADGEIMGWLNSDDLLLPGALAYVASYFAAHPDVDLIYGNRVLIDEHGRDIGLWTLPRHCEDALKWVDLVPQECAFWRRHLWERLEGLDERFGTAFDWDFFRRAEATGAKIVRVPRFLGAYRQHARQKTRTLHQQSAAEQARIREQSAGRPVAAAEIRVRMVPYLLRSLPHQYWHRATARLSTRRVPAVAHPIHDGAVRIEANGSGARVLSPH